jgi:hypothetical protein
MMYRFEKKAVYYGMYAQPGSSAPDWPIQYLTNNNNNAIKNYSYSF